VSRHTARRPATPHGRPPRTGHTEPQGATVVEAVADTPHGTSCLEYTEADGTEVRAAKFLNGALPFDTFKDTIDKFLNAPK
jgi:hypothetical protein